MPLPTIHSFLISSFWYHNGIFFPSHILFNDHQYIRVEFKYLPQILLLLGEYDFVAVIYLFLVVWEVGERHVEDVTDREEGHKANLS